MWPGAMNHSVCQCVGGKWVICLCSYLFVFCFILRFVCKEGSQTPCFFFVWTTLPEVNMACQRCQQTTTPNANTARQNINENETPEVNMTCQRCQDMKRFNCQIIGETPKNAGYQYDTPKLSYYCEKPGGQYDTPESYNGWGKIAEGQYGKPKLSNDRQRKLP